MDFFVLLFLNGTYSMKENWKYITMSYRLQKVMSLRSIHDNSIFLSYSRETDDWKASSCVNLFWQKHVDQKLKVHEHIFSFSCFFFKMSLVCFQQFI